MLCRKIKKFISKKWKKFKRFVISKHFAYSLIINIPISASAILCFLLFLKSTEFNFWINTLAFIVIIPPLFFQIFVQAKDIEKEPEEKNLNLQKIKESTKYVKHLANFLTLLLFYSGVIVAIEYFKPISHSLNVPKLEAGTVGFRSNNAEVQISSIRIWYQDTLKIWKEVDSNLVSDKRNWLRPVKPWSDSTSIKYRKCIHVNKDTFIIKNTTILFFPPKEKLNFKFQNVRLQATVKFINQENDFSCVSFITNRTNKITRYKSAYNEKVIIKYKTTKKCTIATTSLYHYDVPDLCLEFTFPFNDYAHPWIPALEWMPGITQRSSFLDVEESPIFVEKKKEIGDDYTLSAFVFDNQIRFTVNAASYKGVRCLFEAKVEK